ncbi:MAG: hypothetical protein ACRC53_04225 [Plesiomonas sp.]|uniref:hypothetical protein n=1 Tax=Plesiomonas sp. TaxID=2486279 RepID=UPI003F2AB076
MHSTNVVKTTCNSVQKLERIKYIKYVKQIKQMLSTPDITEQEKASLIQEACTKLKCWQKFDLSMLFSDNPELMKIVEKIRQCQSSLQSNKSNI